jgi:hypothetical protein
VKLDPYLTLYIKTKKSKWIKDLSVRFKMVKLLEEKHREKLHDIDLGNDFLGLTPSKKSKGGSGERLLKQCMHI